MRILIGAGLSTHWIGPGSAWYRLQFASGLKKLGHEVYVIEHIEPEKCRNEKGELTSYRNSLHPAKLRRTLEPFGMLENVCQIYNEGEETLGFSMNAIHEIASTADLLINFTGHLRIESILSRVDRRVYIDQDPLYTQVWHTEYKADMNFSLHNIFFSRGLNIGTEFSDIPDCGLRWHKILPPVIPDYWPYNFNTNCRKFTTVATWAGGSADSSYRNEWFRAKYVQFPQYAELPKRSGQEFEVALRNWNPNDEGIQKLKDGGWVFSSANDIKELIGYQNFIGASRAEIGIAKEAYVKSTSGWFSERSSHYLVSGKPVLALRTGLENWLPLGAGLLQFSNMEEALNAIEEVNSRYQFHCEAARDFAQEYLDYRKVLPEFLDTCMTSCI